MWTPWIGFHPSCAGLLFNSLRPRPNRRYFADDILKRIFFNENVWISIKISLKFVPKGLINNIPALVQIMAWRRSGDKPLSEPMMVGLPTLGLNELIANNPLCHQLIGAISHHKLKGVCKHHRHIDILLNILLRPTGKKISKIRIYWPFDMRIHRRLVDTHCKEGPGI